MYLYISIYISIYLYIFLYISRKKNVTFSRSFCKRTERSRVLFRSFQKNGKERKERNVLLQRTEKNGKNAPFFLKERKRTRERSVLLQKNARTFRSFFYMYMEIYIDIYRHIYIKKRTELSF